MTQTGPDERPGKGAEPDALQSQGGRDGAVAARPWMPMVGP